jgi:hypothetical protein
VGGAAPIGGRGGAGGVALTNGNAFTTATGGNGGVGGSVNGAGGAFGVATTIGGGTAIQGVAGANG